MYQGSLQNKINRGCFLMALNTRALQELLRKRLCEDIHMTERPDGALLLRTHFEFPDGDQFPIHVSQVGSGGLRLSDYGHTLMHISYVAIPTGLLASALSDASKSETTE